VLKFLFTKMDLQKYSQRKKHPVRNFFAVVVPVVLLLIGIQYAVLSVLAVRRYQKNLYKSEDVMLLSVAQEPNDSTFSLYKDKTWLESRFQITKTDSISLSVNLRDSVLQLELKGVVLKSSKMIDFKIDELFKHLKLGAYHHYFGEPALGESLLATIEKEPLIVKKAPRDSVEFANQSHVIDSTKQEAVHWLVELDNDISLKIEGVDQNTSGDWLDGKQFWWKQDLERLKTDLSKTFFFEVPDYKPELTIILNESDAKAIFRALPMKPQICIRL